MKEGQSIMRANATSKLPSSLILLLGSWGTFGCASILGIEDTAEGMPDAAVVADAAVVPDAAVAIDAQASFTVRGTAAGVLDPLSLRLEYSGGNELLSIVEDGSFAFPVELRAGDSYQVVFVGEPPCVLEEAVGVVVDEEPTVTLACDGVFLADLTVSGVTAPTLAIDPARATYEVDVSLLQSYASVTAVPTHADASIAIDGVAVDSGSGSGVASAPIALDVGENVIEVAVTSPGGGTRTYRITVRRAVEIVQAAYGKASNTGSSDEFGYSVALSGDTLAVGAYLEDSAATGIDGDQSDNAAFESGAVYVFRRSGTSWAQEAYLKASNTGSGDYFGVSVALSGDTLAVGAYFEDSAATGIDTDQVDGDQADNAASESGAVYFFH